MQDIDESPWDDSPLGGGMTHVAEAEWTRLSSSFQNAGYREGITAGKEGALQEGFDTGFAQTGGPVGRELGLLRGVASALLLHLSRTRTQHEHDDEKPHAEPGASENVREIVDALAAVQFADIVPPLDDEAEGHTHCAEDLKSGRDDDVGGEGEEETSPSSRSAARLGSVSRTIEDVRALRVKLETLLCESGLNIDLNLEIF
ncbi:hypothetical protein BGY98DRAFT_1097683 [Russula aff. rugulosa BPL654]|nr:hypothetical protein BGY98DRAFT_1097683 [Russula aff. rugulosa BPL654]